MRMRKNIAVPKKTQMTVWRMNILLWIRKATNTHSEYVVVIAFPLQQWFLDTPLNIALYVHCLCCYLFDFLFCIDTERLLLPHHHCQAFSIGPYY